VQQGRKAEAGSLARFPGPALEKLLQNRLALLGMLQGSRQVRDVVERVVVGRRGVQVRLAPDTVLPASADVSFDQGQAVLTLSATLKWRGGSKTAVGPGGAPAVDAPRMDLPLAKALVRAEAWKRRILAGEATLEALACAEGLSRTYAQRVARIALLSPQLKRAILDGRQPPKLSLRRLLQEDIPIAWADQQSAWA
jgi:hypothetical protein